MTSTHHRLVLDLSLAAGELRATLTHSGPRLAPVQTWASRAVDVGALRSLQARMTAVLNRANRWGDMDQGSRALLRQRGALLFDEVLPRAVKDTLRELGSGELTLVLDEALVFVPWELMHTGLGFIGLDWMVGRIVRTPHAILGQSRPQPLGPWRMLILCDPRGDLLGSYYEGITLRDQLDDARKTLAIDLRSSEVGVSDVKQLVREYDLIHYAGHAELHPDRPSDSGWLLSDGILNPEDLLSLAGGQSFPRVVFSNACRSGQVDGSLLAPGDGEAIFSIANAFLLAGVHHYIGTLWDIPDEPACHFSLAFYASLAAGATLGESLRDARHALATRYGEDSVLWASYLLYGDPSVPCFSPDEATQQRGLSQHGVPDVDMSPPEPSRTPLRPTTPRVRGGSATRSAAQLAALDVAGVAQRVVRRAWPLLALAVAAIVGAVTLLAPGQPSQIPGITDGPYVGALVPARYEAPAIVDPYAAPLTPTPSSGPANAAVPAVPVVPLTFAVVSQDADSADPQPASAPILRSGDNFQIRYSLARPGFVAIFHIESQGAIRLIHEAPPHESASVTSAVALPGSDSWFYLDDRRGLERFVLAVSHDAKPDSAAFLDALAPLSAALALARGRDATPRSPLKLRGLGGTRYAPRPRPASERDILDKIDAHVHDAFDVVRIVEVVHR